MRRPSSEESIDPVIGERLRVWRERRGYTRAGLARVVGVEARSIRRYETSAASAPISVVVKIARALGGSAGLLIDAEGDRWREALRELVVGGPEETAELVEAFLKVRDPDGRRAFLDLALAIVRAQAPASVD